MICFGCSAKIPYSEIYKKRRMADISQCSRFIWMFRCNKCNKTFNYLSFQKHKELFKKTLIDINGLQECRSFSSNVGQCYSFEWYNRI